jgi:hypothetical protein
VEIRDIIRAIGREKTIILIHPHPERGRGHLRPHRHHRQSRIVADGSTEMLKLGAGRDRTISLTLAGVDAEQAKRILSDLPASPASRRSLPLCRAN